MSSAPADGMPAGGDHEKASGRCGQSRLADTSPRRRHQISLLPRTWVASQTVTVTISTSLGRVHLNPNNGGKMTTTMAAHTPYTGM